MPRPKAKQKIKARLTAPPKPGVVGNGVPIGTETSKVKVSKAANELLTKGYKTLK